MANTELLVSPLSLANNKDVSHERHKRDTASDNSSTLLPSNASVHTGPLSSLLSNNVTEEEPMLSDADADTWARSLSLSNAMDGSGFESK